MEELGFASSGKVRGEPSGQGAVNGTDNSRSGFGAVLLHAYPFLPWVSL